MTNKTLTLAALLLASSTMTTVANAGGVRLSMAGPLGSFTAHPHLSSGPGGTARYSSNQSYSRSNPHCDKPAYAKPSYIGRFKHDDAPVRTPKRAAPKVDVAEEAPAPRRIKKAPKIEVAEEAPVVRKIRKPRDVVEQPQEEPAEVKTAKLEDKSTASDAAPAIFVPEAPPAPTLEFTGTQSTPAPARTAAIAPAPETKPAAEALKAESAKVETKAAEVKSEPTAPAVLETKPAKSTSDVAKKLCKRFSAAVAGLIDVPCGD